ncbi:unnamed protein product [Cuscuta epithymum]|uniref:RING-type domain-containing protein n=1 Tax=Cuscuta epithymum TaxID=186058 RepID=A0AAV0CGD5_9ASTE|nr:unnamed protein product [Cuscuta epithymum]
MAVEATHLNLFQSQQPFMPNREFLQGNQFGFDHGEMRSAVMPLNLPAAALPGRAYALHPSLLSDSVQAKTSMNADSCLTYNLQQQLPKKRSRDSLHPSPAAVPQKPNLHQIPSFFGEDDVLPIVQQYQLDIDSIVSHHTKKIKMEFEERQKQQGRVLVASIGEKVMKKLKEKDDHIQRMMKLNMALQEKLKNLYVENQLWRDLAQSNEATANSLRSDLEQVLNHIGGERISGGGAAEEEDAGSCCGSYNPRFEEPEVGTGPPETERAGDRMCRKCGERESTVLLLPCRHLCLCSVCGSTTMPRNCPICNSSMNATVHVNL